MHTEPSDVREPVVNVLTEIAHDCEREAIDDDATRTTVEHSLEENTVTAAEIIAELTPTEQ